MANLGCHIGRLTLMLLRTFSNRETCLNWYLFYTIRVEDCLGFTVKEQIIGSLYRRYILYTTRLLRTTGGFALLKQVLYLSADENVASALTIVVA